MTDQELKDIVVAVVAELEKSGVDFDYKAEQAKDDDLVFVIRGTAPNYQGVTVTWKGLLDIITAQATQAKNDAETAKNVANTILEQVQSKGTEITNFVATSKAELETQKNESVNAVKSVYQTDLNELKGDLTVTINSVKQELDDKKITKFYASNNGNTNLPDSDNGKPSDMKIFGKSVQDGTPSPDAPVEIQSVVNPTVKMIGKNLLNPDSIVKGKLIYNYDGEIKTASDAEYYTDYIDLRYSKTVTLSFKNISELWFAICAYDMNKNFLNEGEQKRITSSFTKTFSSKVAYMRISASIDSYDSIQLEYGSVATDRVDYRPNNLAYLPYTLNAIPVTSGGNVTIDGQQYVADYVDVERRKLVRMVGVIDLGDKDWVRNTTDAVPRFQTSISDIKNCNYNVKSTFMTEKYTVCSWVDTFGIGYDKSISQNKSNVGISDSSYTEPSSFKESVGGQHLYYELATPTETDLTESDITALSSLATYYPVTNVSVASNQLDGHAIFNYPLNMANGWNYVMQQIGETRPIIYDTQVKTIENLIDTAILTAMMEA